MNLKASILTYSTPYTMTIDNNLLANLLRQAQLSPRLRQSHDLRNSAEDQSQRMLNALLPGTELPIHRHPTTSESVFLLHGRMDEVFFDNNGQETARIQLDPSQGIYGVQIPQGTWHTVEVFQPSVIVEMKAGSYQPITPQDILQPHETL